MSYKTGRTRTLAWEIALAGQNTRTLDNRVLIIDIPFLPFCEGQLVASAGGTSVVVTPYFAPIGIPTTGSTYSVRYGVNIALTGIGSSTSVNMYNTLTVTANSIVTLTYDIDLAFAVSVAVREVVDIIDLGLYRLIVDPPRSKKAIFGMETNPGTSWSVSCGSASLSGTIGSPGSTSMAMTASVEATSTAGGSGAYSAALTSGPCTYTYTSVSPATSTSLGGTVVAGGGLAQMHIDGVQDEDATPISGSATASLAGDIDISASGIVRAMMDNYPDALHVAVAGFPGMTSVSVNGGSWSATGKQKRYELHATANSTTASSILNQHGLISAGLLQSDLVTNGDESLNSRHAWRGYLFDGLSISYAETWSLLTGPETPPTWNMGTTVASGIATLSSGSAVLTASPPISALPWRHLRIRCRSVGVAGHSFNVLITPYDPYKFGELDTTEFGGGSPEREDVYTGAEEPDKNWLNKTGDDGEWVYVTLDLAKPDNLSAVKDDQDTRFPLPTRMPQYYGVSRIPEIRFDGLPTRTGDDTEPRIEISAIEFFGGDVEWECLPVFVAGHGHLDSGGNYVLDTDPPDLFRWKPREIFDNGTEVDYWEYRFLVSRDGGKAGIEEQGVSLVKTDVPETGISWSFPMPPIAGMASTINGDDQVTLSVGPPRVNGSYKRYPGVTATVSAPSPTSTGNLRSDYLNSGLEAVLLCGAGAWFGSDGWHLGLDLTSGVLPAQDIYDEVAGYPDCGDVFGTSGGGTGALSLHGASIARGDGQALVFKANGTPAGGVTLEALEGDPLVSRGTGSTDGTNGYAQTGLSALHAPADVVLAPPSGGDPAFWEATFHDGTLRLPDYAGRSITIHPHPRWRSRGAFLVIVGTNPTRNVAVISHPYSGFYGKAEVSQDGMTLYWRRTEGNYISSASLLPPVAVTTVGGSELLSSPTLVFYQNVGQDLLQVMWAKLETDGSSNIYQSTSADYGDTWETPTVAFAGGTQPMIGKPMHGGLGEILRVAFIPDGGDPTMGTLQGTLQYPGDAAPSAPFTFQQWDGSTLSDLIVSSTGYDLEQMQEGQARWGMSLTVPGDDSTSDWYSADDGHTWIKFV